MNCKNNHYLTNLLQVIVVLIAALCSAGSLAAGGESVVLSKTYSGNIDYVATGNSFRTSNTPGEQCFFSSPMESTVVVNMPIGVTILDAFLYFAGSGRIDNLHGAGSTLDLVDQTNLKLNGVSIPTSAGSNGRDFAHVIFTAGGNADFFGARRDVSDIVTGTGAYTLSGLVVDLDSDGRPNGSPTWSTCTGAWSLIVVYEDPNVSQIRVINIFDGFKDFYSSNFALNPRNFVVDVGATGKMTHMSFEGDADRTGTESFEVSAGGDPPVPKTNAMNPLDNQYNSTVTGPDVFDSNTTYGFDLDTYDITSELAGHDGEYEITTSYITGTDLVILMAEVISVDNKALADIEVTLNDIGLFESSTSNSAQYVISVQNNGDGTSNAATGFATGYIHVYDNLPAGISIDDMTDITAPGWDCSGTVLAADQVRCTYDLSTLSGGQLNRDDFLPDIYVTVDIATPASPVTNIAHVSLCNDNINDPDDCTNFDEKHTDADQFDPVNAFEPTEDLFDITAKSATNNNVDEEITAIITGSPSDLSNSTKGVADLDGGTLDPGDIIEYTITLIETANVAATSVSITDPIDDDTTSFSYQSSNCVGAVDNFTADTLTVTGMTVPANGSCTVIFRVTVDGTASAGTAIDNSAIIANGNGTGGTATAPTLLVAGTATGSKVLYLDNLSTTKDLSRTAPGLDTSVSIATSGNTTMTLSPTLAASLDINNGIIPVSVWIEAASAGDYDVTAELRYDSTGANSLIGTASLNSVTMATGAANAQLFPFQINLAADITDLDLGEDITLTVFNGAGSPGNAIFHSLLNSFESHVVVDAANVINLDSITFYDDAGRSNVVTTIEAGLTIYIEAVISDPFGAFDITDSKLTLIDPNLANQLTDVAMTEDVGAATTGSKTFYYAYNVPSASSISPGVWVAQITSNEGAEGTISHTDVNSFTTTAPTVEVDYSVTPITASAGNLLTYTLVITNSGGAPASGLFINQPVPADTENITVTSNGGGTDSSSGTNIDISNISVPAGGSTTIIYTVNVVAGVQSGDLIDHTISVDNAGTAVTDIAASVLIDPYDAPAGNKLIYADNLSTSKILDRTVPVSDTTLSVSSQGGNTTLSLSPVLQSDLNLAAGNIEASVWVSRGASFAGQRTIVATLGYTGASSGTIDSDTVTITLQDGAAGAQYVPFVFALGSPLTISANSSITLTITNNTAISGETITLHSFKDLTYPTRVALNATTPLTIEAIEVLNNDLDLGGTVITSAGPTDTIWVRATVQDPFGSTDISSATLTITDPLTAVTLSAATMSVPTTQPASGAQKYFQLSHTLTSVLGDWDLSVTANEGSEGTVSATSNVLFDVNNNSPNLTTSYKTVANATTGDNADTNEGDTLHYTIELIESTGATATNVDVTDNIPANTTFVSGTLMIDSVVQADPGDPISLTGLTVPSLGSMTIEFDVTIDTPTSIGTIISNSANIANPNGAVTSIDVDAEDLVITGAPASGTKSLYLQDLDQVSPLLTRLQPQAPDAADFIFLDESGSIPDTVSLDLTPVLAREITLDSGTGPIAVTLRMKRGNGTDGNRKFKVDLGYHNGGSVTTIGSVTSQANLTDTIQTYNFSVSLATTTVIPAGNQIRLTVTNERNRPAELYSFDSAGNRSTVDIVPDSVINVDSITFWTGTMGAGTQVTNPDPNGVDVDIYAKIVVSDPFGEADIQAPDAATNPTTVVITDPDGNAVLDASTACTAPCYAYDGEDTTNDPANDATRTFYYIVRIDSDPPATRGTWTVTVTANEGLETGLVSHVAANTFTTLTQSNLSTSTKFAINVVGDIDPSDTLTYETTLINTGGQDADNVIFSDTLQSSPVALTFSSASTTCTDEVPAALPNPSHAGGVVSLSNISITAGGSCKITIVVTVGAGTPGDLIDNSATITNPVGPGATPSATTLLLSESQIPVAGSKQLYLEGIGGGSTLTRTQPTSGSSIILDFSNTTESLTFSATTRAMTLSSGPININLNLGSDNVKNARNRNMTVELFVDANDGNGLVSIDSLTKNVRLHNAVTLQTFNLTNAADLALLVGTTFQLDVTNLDPNDDKQADLVQVTSAPFSEVVVPVTGSIEVTELKFYDRSGTDETGNPGCSPACGSEVTPTVYVESGSTIWTRGTIADAFGSFDVNTGCDGVTVINCPTITITDPLFADKTPVSPADELTYLQAPDTSSRQYEFEVDPSGLGLDGVWQIEVLGTEGVEDVMMDSAVVTFERFSPPVLTIVKTAIGTTLPGQIVTYNNNVTNTGASIAKTVILTNTIGSFLQLELVESGGSWTAVFSLSAGFSINVEEFDSGGDTFTYDPVTGCGASIPANSPCYDPAVVKWRIELNETLPVSGNIIEEYRAMID